MTQGGRKERGLNPWLTRGMPSWAPRANAFHDGATCGRGLTCSALLWCSYRSAVSSHLIRGCTVGTGRGRGRVALTGSRRPPTTMPRGLHSQPGGATCRLARVCERVWQSVPWRGLQ